MSERPSFEQLYMDLAWGLSKRSTCRRLSVGCVITSTDFRHVLGVGFNGNASGLANDCESDTPGACGDIHAEANAIINCCAPRSQGKVVIVTHQPCKMCAKMLVNLGGVERVIYQEPYRLVEGLDVLTRSGIEWVQTSTRESESSDSCAWCKGTGWQPEGVSTRICCMYCDGTGKYEAIT